MADYTPNYNLYKPNRNDTEPVDTTLSANFEKVDIELWKKEVDILTLNHDLTTNTNLLQEQINNNSLALQEQINTLVANGDSSPAIEQALAGTPYVTLRQKHEAIDSRIAARAVDLIDYESLVVEGNWTEAIKAACADIQLMGGGKLFIPKGEYHFTATKGTFLYEFSGLNYFELEGNNAKLIDDQIYSTTVAEQAIFFQFRNCKNVSTQNGLILQSQLYESFTTGLIWYNFVQGCENLDINADIIGGRNGVRLERAESEPLDYVSKNIKANIKAVNVRYPYSSTRSGDSAEVRLNTDYCGRSFFVYNCKNVKIHCVAKNDLTSLIKVYTGGVTENIDVYYENTDSTRNTGQVGEKVSVHFGDITPATFKNIKVRLNVKNYAGGWGSPFSIVKWLNDPNDSDSVGRGHVIDGLTISGYSKGISGVSQITTMGKLAAPDVVKNLKIDDFTLVDGGSLNLDLGDTLQGTAHIRNSSNNTGNLNIINSTGLALFENCKTLNFGGSNTSTSVHKYVNSEITNGASQNYSNNKEFVNTNTPIGTITSARQIGTPGNSKSSVTVLGSLATGKNIFKINTKSSGYYRLSYYLSLDRGNVNPGTRTEKFGAKSWTMTVNGSGVLTLQSPVSDEVTERIKGDFTGALEVTLVNGDANGAFVNVKNTQMTGTNASGTFSLECLAQNGDASILPIQ